MRYAWIPAIVLGLVPAFASAGGSSFGISFGYSNGGSAFGISYAQGGHGHYGHGGYGYPYYGSYYDDSYAYYGDDDDYVVAAQPSGGDEAYCMQRFKSYDPASGTYLGYDGQRHPCP